MSDDQVTSLFMAAAMVGGWLAEHAAQIAIIGAVGGFAWWNIRRLLRGDDHYHSGDNPEQGAWLAICNDQRPEPAQPGTDIGLYLDAVAVLGDCEELDRLRNVLEQHRKENPL